MNIIEYKEAPKQKQPKMTGAETTSFFMHVAGLCTEEDKKKYLMDTIMECTYKDAIKFCDYECTFYVFEQDKSVLKIDAHGERWTGKCSEAQLTYAKNRANLTN
jgi:hypothetical protein